MCEDASLSDNLFGPYLLKRKLLMDFNQGDAFSRDDYLQKVQRLRHFEEARGSVPKAEFVKTLIGELVHVGLLEKTDPPARKQGRPTDRYTKRSWDAVAENVAANAERKRLRLTQDNF